MLFPNKLEKLLSGDLPGIAAHVKMVSPGRSKFKYDNANKERIQAAVLVLMFPVEDTPNIVYIKRTGDFGVKHGGQISFPGGRAEEIDEGLQQTALREAQEEVGIDADKVRVLGRLSSLYIPVSNFLVHPFVGWLEQEPELTAQESEVADIIQLPISHLQKPGSVGLTSIQVREDHTINDVPFYDVNGHVLWGATAMMTSELLEILPLERVS